MQTMKQGAIRSKARAHEGNCAVDNKEVEELLKDPSLTSTAVSVSSIPSAVIDHLNSQNTFSKLLVPLRFNTIKALVNDFMHK